MAEHPRIVVIGEGMLELSRGPGGSTKLAYGGDTLNTAVYLARVVRPENRRHARAELRRVVPAELVGGDEQDDLPFF